MSAMKQEAIQQSLTRDDLLTATEVAEVLRVKRSTALDYMRRGVVPACKIGRRWYVLRTRLDAHINELFSSETYR
jgi:excisionase family DNA binding protein